MYDGHFIHWHVHILLKISLSMGMYHIGKIKITISLEPFDVKLNTSNFGTNYFVPIKNKIRSLKYEMLKVVLPAERSVVPATP